jgi:hypothetical protein
MSSGKIKNDFIHMIRCREGKNASNIAYDLLNAYYKNCYNGSENRQITAMYFDSIYFELFIWIGQNFSYLKQEESKLEPLNNFFKKELHKARIRTYEYRRKLYHEWLIKKDDDPLVKSLLMCYTSIEESSEVKRELDLIHKIEE